MHQPDPVIDAPGAGDLPVPGVMADKGELGEHHRQIGRGAQLPPGLANHNKADPAGSEQGQGEPDPGHIPAPPTLQQPSLLDLPRQLGVLSPTTRGHQPRPNGRFVTGVDPASSVLSSSG
jgi:hypothetical protein